MQRDQTCAGCDGFTLVEVLAAFAIGAVIIAACAALIHNVVLNFDRGTRTVDVAERFVLAIDRLSADFASARAESRAPQRYRHSCLGYFR